MKRRPFVIVTLAALLVSVFCVIPCSCIDRSLSVKGVAYEWIDAPSDATSRIYVENINLGRDVEPTLEKMLEDIASDISIVPLRGVKIAIGSKSSIEKEGEEGYHYKLVSDLKGNFEEFWRTGFVREQGLVKASKSGYTEVVEEVEFGGTDSLRIIVILVKENDQN